MKKKYPNYEHIEMAFLDNLDDFIKIFLNHKKIYYLKYE